MFRFHTLRRVRGPADLRRLEKVMEFYRHEFPSTPQFGEALRQKLLRPLNVGYAATLVTAESLDGQVLGFAFYDHFSDIGLSYLEYIVTAPGLRSQGVGGALYEAMRESLVHDGSKGLLFEVNPDDPELPAEILGGNKATLRFYEKYDARPITGVRFDYPPYQDRAGLLLIFDRLGTERTLDGAQVRAFMRKLYDVKYKASIDTPRARAILGAVPSGVLALREPRYARPTADVRPKPGAHVVPVEAIVSETHKAHHVPERDHLERPLRMERLLGAIDRLPYVKKRAPKSWPQKHITAVHDAGMVRYLERVSSALPDGATLQPTVFPIRRRLPAPGGQPTHAGYYSLDSFTPITAHAYEAARGAVDVALTAAERLKLDVADSLVYAMTRPPGHHAERDLFGGFCYFNNAAIAANWLTQGGGRVAVLDLDFHHGNGAQDIFYRRDDVLTVSIHGDPRTSYPYFVGFAHEKGEDAGFGYNHNIPLPEGIGDEVYLAALRKACRRVEAFEPDWLIVALGLDVSKDDPSGSFRITRKGFSQMARMVADLGVPSMVTQEGGYNLRDLGANLRAFLEGWVHA